MTWVGVFALAFVGTPARAVQYETEIDIRTEQEIYDLYSAQQISEATRDTLLELYAEGVELNTASRDELYSLPNITYAHVDALLEYRKVRGVIADLSELVASGAMEAATLEKLLPFIALNPSDGRIPLSGRLRLLAYQGIQFRSGPPTFLSARVKAPFDLSVGLSVVTTRRTLGAVEYDPLRGALLAEPARYGMQVPRLYLRWKSVARDVVAGTYFVGFGQRLTIDNTKQYTPNGIYVNESLRNDFELVRDCRLSSSGELEGCDPEGLQNQDVPDFSWPRSFRGLAGSISDLALTPDVRVSLHAFGSYQDVSVFQYELYDRDRCENPRDDRDSASAPCKSPLVLERQPDPSAASPSYKQVTLPTLFSEALGGGHVGLKFGQRMELGITGYGATPLWHIDGIRLDLQEHSLYPFGGPFGAVGVSAAYRTGLFNYFAEVTRSFDSQAWTDHLGTEGLGGGGFGALQRTVFSTKQHEAELSLRYYDREFANPYARGIAALDEYEGISERNEVGARLDYTGKFLGDLQLRTRLDFWMLPEDMEAPQSAGTANMNAFVRADYRGWRFLHFGGWLEHRNKDLQKNGFGEQYADAQKTSAGIPIPLTGEWYSAGGLVKLKPLRALTLTASYEHILLTHRRYADRFQTWISAWGEVRATPTDQLFLRARVRYWSPDVEDPTFLEESLRVTSEIAYAPVRQLRVGVQYQLYSFIDQRDSTIARPSPHEHAFRLELESRF